MNKRGQFFLIAALIIAGIIITFGIINITTKAPPEDVTIYDLSNEIDYESSQLIDKGVYMSLGSAELGSEVLSLIGNYSVANPNTDITVVYGDSNSITAVSYEKTSTGSESISGGGGTTGVEQFRKIKRTHETSISGGRVNVQLNETSSVSFDLRTGENFYLILKKEVGGEKLVAQ